MNPNIIVYNNEIQINNISQIRDFNDDVFNVYINEELYEIKGSNLVLKEVFNDNKSITVIGVMYSISKGNKKRKRKALLKSYLLNGKLNLFSIFLDLFIFRNIWIYYLSNTFLFSKKFILIKIILFFLVQAIIYIRISNCYILYERISYFSLCKVGLYLGKNIYKEYLYKINKEFSTNANIIFSYLRYVIVLLLVPEMINFIYCYILRRQYFKRYPHKKKSVYNLYNIKE